MDFSNSFKEILDKLAELPAVEVPASKDSGLKIEFQEDEDKKTIYKDAEPSLPFADSDVFYAEIIDWRRLTALSGDCKAVYEITFDVATSGFTFKAGDTIGLIPQNDDADIDFFLSHLDVTSNADLYYTLSMIKPVAKNKIPAHVPIKSTLRHILKNCVDLRGVMKKLFIRALSRYTTDEKEKKILEFLCSKEGAHLYQPHVLEKKVGLLDIFKTFQSCKPPLEVVLAYLPRLLPRPYSIVNSGLKDNTKVKICFSVTEIDKKRKGLATGWLEKIILNKEPDKGNGDNLATGEVKYPKIPIYVRKNSSEFYMPQLDIPLLLICSGTGIAPFIAFLEEREYIRKNDPEVKLCPVWLMFGCRHPDLDFIYKKELYDFISSRALNKLSIAFSRVGDSSCQYVQDIVLLNKEEIEVLISQQCCTVFVCGDQNKVVVNVRKTLVKCLKANLTVKQSEAYINEMEKSKRYFVDSWG